jgi:hypothetical protein
LLSRGLEGPIHAQGALQVGQQLPHGLGQLLGTA